MNQRSRIVVLGIAGVAVVGGLLYLSGYRIVGPKSELTAGRTNQAGWRRSAEALEQRAAPAGTGRKQVAMSDQGGGKSGAKNQGAGGGGNVRGGQQGRAGSKPPPPGSRGRVQKVAKAGQASARQPGFGPSGGILLPSKIGQAQIPVIMGGKEKATFIGQDLFDHVEDTVIATVEGPRKGWAIAKTLTYLGIETYTEAALVDANGPPTTATPAIPSTT